MVWDVFKSSKKDKDKDKDGGRRRSAPQAQEISESSNAQASGSRDYPLHRSVTDTPERPAPTPSATGLSGRSFGAGSSKTAVEPDSGAIGLSVIYTPDNGHKVDIVFVHGLGGTSRHTWSKYKNPDLFWPLTFLPLEPDVCLARILTFGYNANFRKAGNISSSILDFAKELLFDLKFAKDQRKDDLNMGNVPLIFVVHSMGGLIVKEAYIQGQNDPEYMNIIKAISAITFLATPHRGTNLAVILNRILESTFFSNSKQYISDLSKNSFTLQKLNEQFRHIAPKLDIVSFYETQPTSVGPKNLRVMVLEKDSSILGYPGETSKALNADHHGICKYDSPGDPNYITVRNVLKSLVSKIISTSRSNQPVVSSRRGSLDVKTYLAIAELPDIDFIFFRDQWAEGTSDWILEDRTYLEWFQSQDSDPRILWLNGGAGTGKSVMSSFIINELVEQGYCCQYFFIRSSDQKKRTLSLLLRTIAYQVALSQPQFLKGIIDLADQAIDFNTADPNTIWDRIYKSLLFQMKDKPPLYWIIDGIDEADSPRTIIRQLCNISSSAVPIRLLLVGRKTSEIDAAIQKASVGQKIAHMSIEGHLEDMRRYIRQELSMSGTEEYKENVAQRVVDGSQNIFLWVRFVIDKLNTCYTDDDVELVLRELPVGMEELYDRMAAKIIQNPSPRDRALASTILSCITCSLRVLTVAELSQALSEDTSKILDLHRAILDLCGGFVVIDNGGNVAVIHQTAREYLLSETGGQLSIDRTAAHEQMFMSCMRILMTVGLRAKVNRRQKLVFLDYAASWWSLHLISTPLGSRRVAEVLQKFLTGQWVLIWIEILAISKQLRVLVQASKNLLIYCAKQEEFDAFQGQSGDRLIQLDLFKSWAVDFVKIVGKFGTLLGRDSSSIYKLVPPFCPHSSSIYRQFGKSEARNLAVSGLSTSDWDDSLARLSTGIGTYTASILAAGSQIAILTSPGNVFLYDSYIFEEGPTSPIRHNEPVYRIALNSAGTLVATYGYRTTKVWQISTGKCTMSINNDESRSRPLAMLFKNNDTTLLVGTDDRRLRSIDLNQSAPTWELMARLDEPELEGQIFFLNSASHMALTPDGSLIAIAYRGHPTSAWEVDGQFHIGHCWIRGREKVNYGEVIDACWHPHYPELIGLYLEGVVFKWRPYEDTCHEFPVTGVSRLQISQDGNLFATGDVHGTVKVYTTADLKLIYQLSSQDPVLGLAFSPDLRRFYDIRGYYGNAWEPNALMRFAEQTYKGMDSESETDSIAQNSTTSVSACHWIDSVTTLSASPTGRLYCFGTEKGMVELHDTKRGKLDSFKTSKSYLSIEAMCWSSDGKFVSFSDSSKTIFVHSIRQNSEDSGPLMEMKVQVSMKMSTSGHVSQILFSQSSDRVLVYTISRICTISLASSEITHFLELSTAECRWIIHPQDAGLIVGFGANMIQVLDWELRIRQTFAFEPSLSRAMQNDSDTTSVLEHCTVDRVLVAHSKKHVLVQMSTVGQNSREKLFFVFETSSFSTSAAPTVGRADSLHATPITPMFLPQELSSQTTLALSFLPGNRLISLSRNFSICSWQLSLGPAESRPHQPRPSPTTTGTVSSLPATQPTAQPKCVAVENSTNLFSLPGDWISRECLALCSIWGIENSLLCPRNGEVAVVRCANLS